MRRLVAFGSLASFLWFATSAIAQNGPPGPPGPPNGPPRGPPPPNGPGRRGPPGPPDLGPTKEPAKRGLVKHEKGAQPGYTLIAPLHGKTIELVDLEGRVVHEWKSAFGPGSEIFTDDGHLLRCCQVPDAPRFKAGGQCGRIEELDWDGKVTWDYTYATDEHLQHHDLELLPDGNVLFIAYEYKSRADAVAAGRHPTGVGNDGLWAESIVEVAPKRPSGGEIVWEWRIWDHLVQDVDKEAENYGDVLEHPELLDLNADLRREPTSSGEVDQMKKLGYIANNPTPGELNADWLHVNAVDYDAEHDLILMGSPHLNEIWIVDHSTTTDEAASHAGGTFGHGGDLLWRWGNPRNFGTGSSKEQQLFGQHDPRWIRPGLHGAGHLTVFDNGARRPDGNYSRVLELELPLVDAKNSKNAKSAAKPPKWSFAHEVGLPFAPAQPTWSYTAPTKTDFFSGFISGATRLPNGDTLICEGASGRVFEVTPASETVWDFYNPWGEADVNSPAPQFALFRATRIPADHPGLKGRKLEPIAEPKSEPKPDSKAVDPSKKPSGG